MSQNPSVWQPMSSFSGFDGLMSCLAGPDLEVVPLGARQPSGNVAVLGAGNVMIVVGDLDGGRWRTRGRIAQDSQNWGMAFNVAPDTTNTQWGINADAGGVFSVPGGVEQDGVRSGAEDCCWLFGIGVKILENLDETRRIFVDRRVQFLDRRRQRCRLCVGVCAVERASLSRSSAARRLHRGRCRSSGGSFADWQVL